MSGGGESHSQYIILGFCKRQHWLMFCEGCWLQSSQGPVDCIKAKYDLDWLWFLSIQFNGLVII